jgi:hypothetical protein
MLSKAGSRPLAWYRSNSIHQGWRSLRQAPSRQARKAASAASNWPLAYRMAASSTAGALEGAMAVSGMPSSTSRSAVFRSSRGALGAPAATAGARRLPAQAWSSKMSDVISSSISSILAAVARAISRWRSRSASVSSGMRVVGANALAGPDRSLTVAARGRAPARASGASFFFFRKEKSPTSVLVTVFTGRDSSMAARGAWRARLSCVNRQASRR